MEVGFWCAGQDLLLGLSISYTGELIGKSLTSFELTFVCFSVMFVIVQYFLKNTLAID